MDLSDRASKTDDHYRNKSILMPDPVYAEPSRWATSLVAFDTYSSAKTLLSLLEFERVRFLYR